MTLIEIYDFIKFLGDKDFNGNFYAPEDFQLSLISANLDLLKKVTGMPEEYQIGNPLAREYLEMNQKAMDEIKQFKEHVPAQAVVTGYFDIPVNYLYWDAMSYKESVLIDTVATDLYRPVELLREPQLADRLGNYTKRPTKKYPVSVMRVKTSATAYRRFFIYPATIDLVDFHYYRLPAEPVFAYNIVNDEVVYDAGSSTEFEWGPEKHPDLIRILLSYLGENLKDESLVQYAEMQKAKGI